MAFKVKIDNVDYDLKDNFTIKEELNETLDSATIQFNVYGQEANFESFDVAQIYDSNNKITRKYFLVDSIDEEIHSYGSSLDTSDKLYTVSLFSETKELERITLPNCSVTQPLSGRKKSVWQEIERFCSLYVPRILVYDEEETYDFKYQRKYSLDSALRTRFSDIVCPEFQWNNPTLREVLNDLVSTDDCIIVARQGIISFYDLKQKGNPIDVSKLSYSKKTMSSQDAVGELTVDMQNAIGKNSSSIVCEGVTLRAPEGEGSLTTINGILTTRQPIYAIKKLRVKVPITVRTRTNPGDEDMTTSYAYAWLDITDRVLEKEEFDLLSNVRIQDANSSLYQGLPSFTDQNGVTEKKHKVNFLYFQRGGTDILNVGTNYPKQNGVTTQQTYFSDFALSAITDHLSLTGHLQQGVIVMFDAVLGINGSNDPRNLQFYIEYETVAEHALKVGKYLPVKHPDNRIFDNQSNSYVDQEHMSVFEYAKINRLGHKLRTIAGDYYNESEIPQLGDYIGDEILFSREVTYQDNMLKFKGMLCPNYVLRDFFTGVRAKKRSWQIAKNEDALTRHDVYKLYIEASHVAKGACNDYSYDDADAVVRVGDPYSLVYDFIPFNMPDYHSLQPHYLLGCYVSTFIGNINLPNQGTFYPNSSQSYFLDSQTSLLGRSICIEFGFNDNYKSADYIVSDGTETTQDFYPYTDENGEFDYEFLTIGWVERKSGSDSQRTESTLEQLYSNIRDGYVKPKVTTPDAYDISQHLTPLIFNVKKDNREIIKHTLQLEFCSDTEDIIITDNFYKRMLFFVTDYYLTVGNYVYVSTEKYDKDATQVKGEFLSAQIEKTNDNNDVRVRVVENGTSNPYTVPQGIKSWGIVDGFNNLLLAVNLPENATKMECWFNLLRTRDTNVYSDTYNGIVVFKLGRRTITRATRSIRSTASETVIVQGRTIVRSEAITSDSERENENR